MKPVRVLVVDDSPFVREFLTRTLTLDPQIQVVGTAENAFDAREKVLALRPDVITLDVEMPRMNGVEFLKRLMAQFPLPVIMVSSLTTRGKTVTLDSLAAGALDFVPKPQKKVQWALDKFIAELRIKIKAAATARLPKLHQPSRRSQMAPLPTGDASRVRVIAMGASTGGTAALTHIFSQLPADIPPTVVVQHMPAGFTGLFAEQLNRLSECDIHEARQGELLKKGNVLIAPGGQRTLVVNDKGELRIQLEDTTDPSGHSPSVDDLFESVAQAAAADSLGVLLTGMGCDGAQGLLSMRMAGARTIAQDEDTCVIFGMPRAAADLGAVEHFVSLSDLPFELLAIPKAGAA